MFTVNYHDENRGTQLFSNVSITNVNYVRAKLDPNWSFHMHSHPDTLELSYVIDGKSALYCGEKFYETQPGDLIIKNSNVMHAEKSDLQNPIEQVCINIKGITVEGLPDNYLLKPGVEPIISIGEKKPLFDQMFFYIIENTVDIINTDLTTVNSMISTILEIIYNDFLNNDDYIPEEDVKYVHLVRKYIESNYTRDLSIDSLAKEFYISPFYLSKKFKAETGFTINQYILNCRMGEAERLLVFSDKAIKDIAADCGYENLPYFYTTFKKFAGCTPQLYKEKYFK